MSPIHIIILTVFLLLGQSDPASAYVWKCHTPQGDIWTSQPKPSDDCEEYDDAYNPSAVPPATQVSPPPAAVAVPPVAVAPVAPPPYVGTYLYPPYYYAPGYYGPGAVIIRPPFGHPYGHGYGGRWYGGRFRRW
ncbi:MAG TPA: hypothetical protein VJ746_15805 [Nitrospira sp.]|nr:hypothetical protein [Nitrospira sp.]